MSKTAQIPEIGAEMLLSMLYPELEQRWTVHPDGTFYRNYNKDVLSLDPEEAQVWLSRDGLLSLLPQGLLSSEEDLRKGDVQEKHGELERQKKILTEAFLPFDTVAFRRLLRAERSVEELLNDKLSYLVEVYFGFDMDAEENPYVREFARLLPCVRQIKGDWGLLRNLLSALFNCKVEMRERRYGGKDSTRQWLPAIRYELQLPDLTPEAFQALYEELLPFRAFLQEWFVPMEVHLELTVREHRAHHPLDGRLTLDYNTEL